MNCSRSRLREAHVWSRRSNIVANADREAAVAEALGGQKQTRVKGVTKSSRKVISTVRQRRDILEPAPRNCMKSSGILERESQRLSPLEPMLRAWHGRSWIVVIIHALSK
jgi:hypothetical protein